MIFLLAPTWSFFQTTTPPFDRVAEITLLLFAFGVVYDLIVSYIRPDAARSVGTALEGPEKAEGVLA